MGNKDLVDVSLLTFKFTLYPNEIKKNRWNFGQRMRGRLYTDMIQKPHSKNETNKRKNKSNKNDNCDGYKSEQEMSANIR